MRGQNHHSYQAGQYVNLCVPAISVLEWHPFSLSSAPHMPTATIHAKIAGDWTRKLHSRAGTVLCGLCGDLTLSVETNATVSRRYTKAWRLQNFLWGMLCFQVGGILCLRLSV